MLHVSLSEIVCSCHVDQTPQKTSQMLHVSLSENVCSCHVV